MNDKKNITELSHPMKIALEVVRSLAESDMVAVPIEPTDEMLKAGAEAGDVTVQTAHKVYEAMLIVADESL